MNLIFSTVGIVGAGAMGRGIAQIAAQAGSTVLLFDTQPEAVARGREAVFLQWDKLQEKGRLDAAQVQAFKACLQPAALLADLSGCDLVVEAVVERLDVKKSLFAELENLVAPQAVLATNTSSLSVTSIAAGLKHPGRLAGYHFFNPVPLMKVVEVIAGLKTDPQVCERLVAYAPDGPHAGTGTGHAGLHRQPRRARLRHRGAAHRGEGVTDFATIDRILKDQAGFKLGPFELMDLTGAGRVAPGDGVGLPPVLRRAALPPQRHHGAQRLAGGVLGRKTSEGFYRYEDGHTGATRARRAAGERAATGVGVHPGRAPCRAVPVAQGPGRPHRNRAIALGAGPDAGGAAGL
jgi:3-hydroxybutyryl-CoA dehydrogenase